MSITVYPDGSVNTGITTTTPSLVADPVDSPTLSNTTPTITEVGNFPNAWPINAALEIQSTTGAFILPRVTTAQRIAMVAPYTVNPAGQSMTTPVIPMVEGALVYDITSHKVMCYTGSGADHGWIPIGQLAEPSPESEPVKSKAKTK